MNREKRFSCGSPDCGWGMSWLIESTALGMAPDSLPEPIAVASHVADCLTRIGVNTVENAILRKLEWYRRGGESSERQWRDVVGIVNAQDRQLDRAYLREWAGKLGVSDLIERALRV